MSNNWKDKEWVKQYRREYAKKWYQKNLRRYKDKICLYCKRKFDTYSNDAIFCSNKCSALHKRRNSPHRYKESNGYIMVSVINHPFSYKTKGQYSGYVREHRLVMEKILGRYLKSNELVHHLNGVKDDNRPENLALCYRNTHASYIRKLQERIRELEVEIENHHRHP